MKVLYWIALVLSVVGAVNWGLVGLFEFDLVAYLFGSMMTVAKVVYVVLGVAGVLLLVTALSGGCSSGSCCKTEEAE